MHELLDILTLDLWVRRDQASAMEMTPFALAALVLIMMPGPDQALITRNALVGGRGGGLLTMVGGVAGLTVHATAAALGLSALLVASATAFTVLKIVGACYLLWLAVQMLRSAAHTRREPEGEHQRRDRAPSDGLPGAGLPVERAQPQGRALLRHLPAAVPVRRHRLTACPGAGAVRGLRADLPRLVRAVRRGGRPTRPMAAAAERQGADRAGDGCGVVGVAVRLATAPH